MITFNANDFTRYLKSGTRVTIKTHNIDLNGKTGTVEGDRLPQDTLELSWKGRGPVRTVVLDDSKEIVKIEESSLSRG